MNHEIPPPSPKLVRTTISVDSETLEVFQRLAAVSGKSQSKVIGEWLTDTMDAASLIAYLMQKARDQPKLVAAELRGYALGLSDLTADLLEQVKGKKGVQGADGKRRATTPETPVPGGMRELFHGLTPPVGNTGGKLPRKPKK